MPIKLIRKKTSHFGTYADTVSGCLVPRSKSWFKCFDPTGERVTPIYHAVRKRKQSFLNRPDFDVLDYEGTNYSWLCNKVSVQNWLWCSPAGYKCHGKKYNIRCNRKNVCPWCWASESSKYVYEPLYTKLSELKSIVCRRLDTAPSNIRGFLKAPGQDPDHPLALASVFTFTASEVLVNEEGKRHERDKLALAEAMVELERGRLGIYCNFPVGHSVVTACPVGVHIKGQAYAGTKIRVTTVGLGLRSRPALEFSKKGSGGGKYGPFSLVRRCKALPFWMKSDLFARTIATSMSFPLENLARSSPTLVNDSLLRTRTTQLRSFGDFTKLKEAFEKYPFEIADEYRVKVKDKAEDQDQEVSSEVASS